MDISEFMGHYELREGSGCRAQNPSERKTKGTKLVSNSKDSIICEVITSVDPINIES